jgi:uncharacterized repeat protein (TIGR03837 family)
MREDPRWDIFCRVVDNFGDAGVCWRLARELAAEHKAKVRLWIDDLPSLTRLNQAVALVQQQSVDGVQVFHWTGAVPATQPAQIVIEAFGCGLPDDYVAAMAQSSPRPVWIVLEYLSAEPWVADHHGLPSPHPRLSLERYFFFPGFVESTGGLLREKDLFARRDRFGAAQRESFWRSVGYDAPAGKASTVSLFAYETAPFRELLQCWEAGGAPVIAAVPESRALPVVLEYFGAHGVSPGRILRRGALELRVVPFLPQDRYDELLWACDFNFVRGEDSFVRAQWAARPFVWHTYPQQDRAHWDKLEAFLALYGQGLQGAALDAVCGLTRLWNQIEVPGVTPASAWEAYARERPTLTRHGAAWAGRIAAVGELAENLARFCLGKLK